MSVHLVDGGVNGAWRTVRVEVTGSCPGAPQGTTMTVSGAVYATWPDKSRAPFEPNPRFLDSLDEDKATDGVVAPDGSTVAFRFRVSGAVRAIGRGTVECAPDPTPPPPPADDSTEVPDPPDAGERSAWSTETLSAPPALVAVKAFTSSFSREPGTPQPRCAVPDGKIRRWAKWVAINPAYDLDIETRSVFGRSFLPPDQLKRIKLHAQGGGAVARHDTPSADVQKHEHLLALPWKPIRRIASPYVIPMKTGTLRLWATLDGVSTNVLNIPVVRCPGIIRQARRSSMGIY